MEKVIYDFYSDLFDSHVYLPTHHLRQDEYIAPSVLPSEIRHAITSMKNCTAPGPDRIKPEHLKNDIGNYRPICLLSVIYKLFTRVILNRIGRILDEGQPCEQAGFRRGFSTIDHIHTLTRLIEVSREYKMPLCLTFIDLKKAFDTVETEAVIEALGNQGVPTQYIRMLRELYDSFTTRISPFYKEVIVNCRPREYHASFGMGRLGSEGRRPLPTSPPLCRRHRAYNTEHRAGGTNAGRV
ncbi:hypothetical protein V3C99_002910 [Haemonchus contortus]